MFKKYRKKDIGINYLHGHPGMEEMLKIDDAHVIIDKKDWQEVVCFFQRNRDLIDLTGKSLIGKEDKCLRNIVKNR